jgi:hypothetical protein
MYNERHRCLVCVNAAQIDNYAAPKAALYLNNAVHFSHISTLQIKILLGLLTQSWCWLKNGGGIPCVQVAQMAKKAQAAKGPLRDHVSLVMNIDDYLRSQQVPREAGADYHDWAGVVTNTDGELIERKGDGREQLGEGCSDPRP